MKENIGKIFDKISPRGSDEAFAMRVIEKAKKPRKINLAVPAAAALALAVLSGGVWAYIATRDMGNDIYSLEPETASNKVLAGIFDNYVENAYLLDGITFAPDYEVLDTILEDGVEVGIAAMAMDGCGSALIAVSFEKQGEDPDFGESPTYVISRVYDESLVNGGEYEFVQGYSEGKARIRIYIDNIPDCPAFENGEVTITPLGMYSGGGEKYVSWGDADIVMTNGEVMFRDGGGGVMLSAEDLENLDEYIANHPEELEKGYNYEYFETGCCFPRKDGKYYAIDVSKIAEVVNYNDLEVFETTAVDRLPRDNYMNAEYMPFAGIREFQTTPPEEAVTNAKIYRVILGEYMLSENKREGYYLQLRADLMKIEGEEYYRGYEHITLLNNGVEVVTNIIPHDPPGQTGYEIDPETKLAIYKMYQNGVEYPLIISHLYNGSHESFPTTFFTVKDGTLQMFWECDNQTGLEGAGIVNRTVGSGYAIDAEERTFTDGAAKIAFDFETMTAAVMTINNE